MFAAAAAKSLQSCPTLCDPIDGSPPGSPVPGILQAITLEWVVYKKKAPPFLEVCNRLGETYIPRARRSFIKQKCSVIT